MNKASINFSFPPFTRHQSAAQHLLYL